MPATPVAQLNSPGAGSSRAHPRNSSPNAAPPAAYPRKNSPGAGLPAAYPRKNSPSTPENSVFRPFWACRANFFALASAPGRAGRTFSRTRIYRTQPRANFETNDTSATAAADQRETTITNARPQTATVETTITSATENHAKNSFFSPAKAMSVSTPRTHERAKATPVSDNWATWSIGPGHGTRGRQQGQSQTKVAHNFPRSLFKPIHKRCNCNDVTS